MRSLKDNNTAPLIFILGGVHCSRKLYKKEIDIIKEINPDVLCLEEITSDRLFIKACEKFSKGKLRLSEFKKAVKFEEYWFKFDPYIELFSFIQKNNINLYPIDHKLRERIKLIRLEKKILKFIKKGKKISKLKRQEEELSVVEREKEMVENIEKALKKYKSRIACVIVGLNHVERLKKVLSQRGYKVKSEILSTSKEIEIYLQRMYRYAIRNKIENLDLPPLVPIFVLVFKLLNKQIK